EWIGTLPIWLQWNLRPAGEYTVFTAFPWYGFVPAGAAVGTILTANMRRFGPPGRRIVDEGVVHAGIATSGAALVGIGYYTSFLPSLYRSSSFWTSSPTFFAIRVGAVMLLLSLAYGTERLLARRAAILAPLDRLGRSSLFVYWIHVELVYGYATWALHQ